METGQSEASSEARRLPISQDEKDLVQRVSAMLLGELTQGGNRDLTTMRLDDLESEVFGLTDRVSRCVAESLLQGQANSLGKKHMLCPCCQRELVPKPSQQRTLPEQKRGVPADAPANGWEGRLAAVIVDGGCPRCGVAR